MPRKKPATTETKPKLPNRKTRAERMTEDEIRLVLTDRRSAHQLAKEIGWSRQSISSIRAGKTYANVFPEIPRRLPSLVEGATTCHRCANWIGMDESRESPCLFGHRDPIEEGPGFARDCSTYAPKDK